MERSFPRQGGYRRRVVEPVCGVLEKGILVTSGRPPPTIAVSRRESQSGSYAVGSGSNGQIGRWMFWNGKFERLLVVKPGVSVRIIVPARSLKPPRKCCCDLKATT